MIYDLQMTIVFFKNLEALNARNEDGSRKYKYIINQGSSRSSKTYSLIDLFDYKARTTTNQRYTVWRDTKTDCKKTVLTDMLKHHRNTNRYQVGYKFNKTESILTYEHAKGFSTVEIHGTDDEETVHGLTQDIAWLNEPYKISKETFDQIDMRSEVMFIDYNPKGEHYIQDIARQENAIVIKSTYKDNPFCPEEMRIKIESYQPLSMARLIVDGLEKESDIKAFENRYLLTDYINAKEYKNSLKKELIRCYVNEKQYSASEYMWKVYGLGELAETPNKIYHNWDEIDDEEFNNIKKQKDLISYYGLDFGFAHPTACVEILYDGDRTFYLKEVFYKPLKECTETLGNLLIGAGVPIGNTTYIFSEPQDNLVGVSNNMVNDLRQWHSLNVVKINKPTYQERFEFNNKVKIYYTKSSRNIHKEYNSYEFEVIKGTKTEKPIKVGDDMMNAIEYGIWGIKTTYNIKI